MKRTILFAWIAAAVCAGCAEDHANVYTGSDNIYFDFDPATKQRDSILYTFAFTPGVKVDTVYLPVRISGRRIPEARQFTVAVVNDAKRTTAQAGLHYEPLQSFYTIPADSGMAQVPFILYNEDPELENRSVAVTMVLTPTEDLGINLPDLITAKVVFSNRLEMPVWWQMWTGELRDYTRTKHALYLIAVGNIDLISSYEGNNHLIPYNLFLIDKLRRFLREPFVWVEQNPDYVLEEKSEGIYDFYRPDLPDIRYTLSKFVADGKYYFIDEYDERVIIN